MNRPGVWVLAVGGAFIAGALTLGLAFVISPPKRGTGAPFLAALRSKPPAPPPPNVEWVYEGPKYGGKTLDEWFHRWSELGGDWPAQQALRQAPAAEVMPRVLKALGDPALSHRDALATYLGSDLQLDAVRAKTLARLVKDSEETVARAAAQALFDCVGGVPGRITWRDRAARMPEPSLPAAGFGRAWALALRAQRGSGYRRPAGRRPRDWIRPLVRPQPSTVLELKANRSALAPHAAALIDAVCKGDRWTQEACAGAMVALGQPGAEALRTALTTRPYTDRIAIMRALKSYPAYEAFLQPTWLALLDESDAQVRSWAASRVVRAGVVDDATCRVMRRLLCSDDSSRRAEALSIVGLMPALTRPLLPELRWTLRREDSGGRRMIAELLGTLGPAARPALPELQQVVFTDLEVFTRAAAFEAMGKIGHMDRSVWDTLARGVEDPSGHTREAAVVAMGRIGRPAVPLLVWCLGHRRPEIVASAAKGIAGVGAQAAGAVPGLEEALRSALNNPEAALPALRALRAIGVPPARLLPQVGTMLAAKTFWHRRAALEFAGECGPEARALLPALLAHTADPAAGNRAVRGWALARIAPKDPAVAAALRSLLIDPDGSARAGALLALYELGPAAVPFVPDLLAGTTSPMARPVTGGLSAEAVVRRMGSSAARFALGNALRDATLPPAHHAVAKAWLARLPAK